MIKLFEQAEQSDIVINLAELAINVAERTEHPDLVRLTPFVTSLIGRIIMLLQKFNLKVIFSAHSILDFIFTPFKTGPLSFGVREFE